MNEQIQHVESWLKRKSAGIPNYVWAISGIALIWWFFLRGKGDTPKQALQNAATQAGAIVGGQTPANPVGRGATPTPGGSGTTPPAGGPSLSPNPTPTPTPTGPIPAPSCASMGLCGSIGSCGACPGAGSSNGPPLGPVTSPGVSPTPTLPQPTVIAPFVPWGLSPQGVTAPNPVTVNVGTPQGGVSKIEVWGKGTDTLPATGQLGWHKWGETNGPGTVVVPTEDYTGSQYVAVALNLIGNNGDVVASGNPSLRGYDPRFQQAARIVVLV